MSLFAELTGSVNAVRPGRTRMRNVDLALVVASTTLLESNHVVRLLSLARKGNFLRISAVRNNAQNKGQHDFISAKDTHWQLPAYTAGSIVVDLLTESRVADGDVRISICRCVPAIEFCTPPPKHEPVQFMVPIVAPGKVGVPTRTSIEFR